jgi:ornithine cyclodeaminase
MGHKIGLMHLRVLTAQDLHAALDMPTAIDAMRIAFGQLSSGAATIPVRTGLKAGPVTLLTMPGALADPPALGAKLVSVAVENRDEGLPAVHAVVVLLDPRTGAPMALMDGEWLTALRTGAGSGLATELLALPEASTLAVIGAGAQARTQIEAVRAVRPIREIRIHSRTRASAEALALELRGVDVRLTDTAAVAVEGAQVVVTATDASLPVIPGGVAPGTHINAVGGYRPDMQEIPSSITGRARVVVDQLEGALAEAGDVIIPISEGVLTRADLVELGAVMNGDSPGRITTEEVTLFKSVGNAAQDLAVARVALDRAVERGLGTVVEG